MGTSIYAHLINARGVNLISLFDGIGGMAYSLRTMGVRVVTYHSYEIDKFCNRLVNKWYGDVIQHGDIKDFSIKQLKLNPDFPVLLAAGSPCQSFSRSGHKKGFDDPRGQLFIDALRIYQKLRPDLHFFENVPLSEKDGDIVNGFLGKPVIYNSAVCSPQRRVRSYWVSGHIPKDTSNLLYSYTNDMRLSDCIVSNHTYVKDQYPNAIFDMKNMKYHLPGVNQQQSRVYFPSSKCPTVLSSNRSAGRIKVLTTKGVIFLNPPDIEKAMGYHLDYTAGFSNTQRYKMLGNSFQIDTIRHLLRLNII